MRRQTFLFLLIALVVLVHNPVDAQTGRRLVPEDGAEGNEFGYSVAIDGDFAVVGAYFDSVTGDRSGSAYIFSNSSSPVRILKR